ncbi:uncharacterized protein LOC144155434 [Haemaphysalis longicornis]
MSSSGKRAVFATQQGRGNRVTENANQDYQVLLPSLPSGTPVLNTVFLHADVKARPYRVEHFRDALIHLGLFQDVLALGAYQMNHLWAVTFKDTEGKKKIISAGEFTVKDHRCLVVDPCNQETRLKLHWVLHNIPDDEVRAALAPYGKVTELTREKWRAQNCSEKLSTTRSISLKLKAGLTVDDLPHQLRVGPDLALVAVPGRAPLCLRCRGTGHIRLECRVPRCAQCRRFGHEENQCVRTYGTVAGPTLREDISDHIMDEADAEETAGTGDSRAAGEATPVVVTPTVTPTNQAESVEQKVEGASPEQRKSADKPLDDVIPTAANETAVSVPVKPADSMEVDKSNGATATVKRTQKPNSKDGHNASEANGEEPPPKAAPSRRPSFKPKPNIPPERTPSMMPPT